MVLLYCVSCGRLMPEAMPDNSPIECNQCAAGQPRPAFTPRDSGRIPLHLLLTDKKAAAENARNN